MDDASTDDTPAIAASYPAPVRHIRQPLNRGIYETTNHGIALARGALIATFHADDVYEPQMLERQVRAFQEHPSVGAVFCLDVFIDEAGKDYGRLRLPADIPGDTPLDHAAIVNGFLRHKNSFLVCPSAMVRAEVYKAVGAYDQGRWRNTSDIDMWLRIAARHRIMVLDAHLMRYRHFKGQSSQRYHRLRLEPDRFFAIMDEHLTHGGRRVAEADALRAYEAHRAEDTLLISVNRYVLHDTNAASETLRLIRPAALLGSSAVQRVRLAALYAVLRACCAMTRSRLLATAFAWRWHRRPRPGKGGESLRAVLADYLRGRDPRAS